MFPLQDTPLKIRDIFNEVQTALYESKLRWFSATDIYNSIQESYNKLVALLCPVERATWVTKLSSPYYNLYTTIPSYMYISGIFNPTTNLWLEGLTYKQMKATYQTYLAIGEPRWLNIVDTKRVIMWPYPTTATGTLFCLFKEKAPTISDDHIPILPFSVGPQLLEYFTLSYLMEQRREFGKAQIWMDRAMKPNPELGDKSIFDQCRQEIQNIARADRENVLEPYRWIFHGGTYIGGTTISGETPVGAVDGKNSYFTLANVPYPPNSLLLTLNGTNLVYDVAYTINGQTIIFNTDYIPKLNDVLLAYYQVA